MYTDYKYSVETKEGNLIKSSIQLNSTPRQILESMSATINFPPPPESPSVHSVHNPNSVDDLIWNAGAFGNNKSVSRTKRDCNLMSFLQDMNLDDIKERKMNRINASAAALVARRAFQFSAIDGTGLGWSSASLAILLSRLTELYEEHKCKLQTKSFYPFRLVLSGDEFNRKIDLHSGVILLNPAATPLQWLNTLQAVTDESVQRLKHNRKALGQNLSKVESFLDVRITKGYTSEPELYHDFIQNIVLISANYAANQNDKVSLTLQLNNTCLVVESEQACRRCKLRKDGNIEVGIGMSLDEIRRALNKFAAQSNEYKQAVLHQKHELKQLQERAIYEFGVHSIQRVGTLVTHDQMSDCLLHILKREEDEKDELRTFISGQSLGITGRGQPCHLGDDGSIVIPWNVS